VTQPRTTARRRRCVAGRRGGAGRRGRHSRGRRNRCSLGAGRDCKKCGRCGAVGGAQKERKRSGRMIMLTAGGCPAAGSGGAGAGQCKMTCQRGQYSLRSEYAAPLLTSSIMTNCNQIPGVRRAPLAHQQQRQQHPRHAQAGWLRHHRHISRRGLRVMSALVGLRESWYRLAKGACHGGRSALDFGRQCLWSDEAEQTSAR
jgi:hypothetical protein